MAEIRAILLTDVLDSTRLAQELGEAELAALWLAHDRLARDLLPAWRGREIDKSDGFLLLFADAGDAVGYAMAYHHALATLGGSLQARAGLHFGPVILRANSAGDVALGAKPIEVEGLAKAAAARVMSLARGGQTLLTAEAREALGRTLGEVPLRLQSHGHWRFKGLAEPIELFEAGTGDTVFMPPVDNPKAYRVARRGEGWLPVREIANNLPHQVSSFIGRERELADLLPRLSQGRLITLFGIGGIGKTRLSFELATAAMGDFADGVWLVELAPLAEPGLVSRAVAKVLGVQEEPGQPLELSLAAFLGEKHVLLLLDNCEHLLDACAGLVDSLLRRCAHLKVVASSREALGIAGEQVVQVQPLALPDPTQAPTVEAVMRCAAAQLFENRALLVRRDFQVTAANAAALAAVCCRLDGIPLAIELAAARVRSLAVPDIQCRLDQRFRLLTGGSRAALPRQQTLRALIDWSYELLGEAEKVLLLRLAVFAGGWTLAAAEQVCTGDGVAETDVLDLLRSLCDKSLATADPAGDTTRYRQLETVRQYALERLLESGAGEALRDRHRDHFLALAETAAPLLMGAEQAQWLRRLEQEHDNLRAALEWSLARAPAQEGLRLCGSLQRLWLVHGHVSEGRAWCTRVLGTAAASERTLERAKALSAAGVLAYHQGDLAAARACHDESLAIRRLWGDRRGVAISLNNLGMVALDQGDRAAARAMHEESVAIARELGNRNGEARSLGNLGMLALAQGDLPAAQMQFEASLAILRELGDSDGIAIAFHLLGDVARRQGQLEVARVHFEESLAILRDLGHKLRLTHTMDELAAVIAAFGDPARAARLWSAADRLREEMRVPQGGDDAAYNTRIAAARAAIGSADAFDRAWQEGRALTLDQAIDLALGGRGA